MQFVIPAPVRETRAAPTASAKQKRTGLIPMVVGTDHQIVINRGTAAQTFAQVRARDPEACPGVKASFVCLHPNCAGKEWPSLAAMYEGHPAPSVMARSEEAHVFGLWSNEPVSDAEVAATKEAVTKAEGVFKRAKARLADAEKANDDNGIDNAEKRIAQAEQTLTEAKARHGATAAPLGLIAPPSLRTEDM